MPEDRTWRSALTEEEFSDFRRDLLSYFAARGDDYSIDFDTGCVTGPGKSLFGLENLAQVYHQEQNDRPSTVAAHFDKLLRGDQEEQKLLRKRQNLGAVRKYLGVRLYPNDYFANIDVNRLITRSDIPDSHTTLVYDLPSTVTMVTREEAIAWKKDDESLFRIGLDNTLAHCKPEISRTSLDATTQIWLVSSDSLFTASYALALEKISRCIGSYGSIVLVPHRHSLVLYPIEDLQVLKAINSLIGLSIHMYKQGPGSITSKVFWYNKKSLIDIPYEDKEGSIQISPPDAFVEVLNQLADHGHA